MQHVDVKVHGAIATIKLDRTQTRNALSQAAIEDLKTAFGDVHQEKRAKAVVLTAAGSEFCSGLDMKVMNDIASLPNHESMPEWFELWTGFAELIEQILRFPKPVIAGVDGSALGAGLALALAADVIVPSKTARFEATAVNRGLVGGITTALLAFRFGAAVAARMSLSGEAIDADEAYRLGMVEKPVDSTQIWVAASSLATRCSQGPREAIQATKRVLNEGVGELMLTHLAAGAADSATACTTESALEGIRAFCQKREPEWP
ncbi:2,3-dehydroadipyl-CoA hydratase [Rubripirellula amarantea]|uniref:2,3-dehydroadipyl-CoA hydratase n=1 Tax=Rubripirellula amarantea TaxID=2527999 RepID=A0A5C5WVB1_9BACT|nr:enoyl-CoA hydratase/isomerase family protein [Rubripirellula amarantea]TWT54061.1 2,3-dehydroadipyl-CoA hydratase [Rubripirellula amarantea]